MTQGSSNQGEAQGLGSRSLPAHWGGNVPSGHLDGSCRALEPEAGLEGQNQETSRGGKEGSVIPFESLEQTRPDVSAPCLLVICMSQ